MKTFFLFLILSSLTTITIAQDDIYYSSPKSIHQKLSNLSDIKPEQMDQYKSDYIRHCMLKYHDAKMTGYTLEIIGVLAAGAGLIIEKKNTVSIGIYDDGHGNQSYDSTQPGYGIHKGDNSAKDILTYGGAALSLSGLFVLIDAEKWMKRAYIGPDGLGVVFKF